MNQSASNEAPSPTASRRSFYCLPVIGAALLFPRQIGAFPSPESLANFLQPEVFCGAGAY
jgi:hypothetical protein